MKHLLYLLVAICLSIIQPEQTTAQSGSNAYVSNWSAQTDRVWIGPEYWANRLQDWAIVDGTAHCVVHAPERILSLLTHDLGEQQGDLDMRVGIRMLSTTQADSNWVGFMLGTKGRFMDYRDTAVHGRGLQAGITASGQLFIGSTDRASRAAVEMQGQAYELRARLTPTGGQYTLRLSLHQTNATEPVSMVEQSGIAARDVTGGLALVSHFAGNQHRADPVHTVAFSEWQIRGSKLTSHPDRAYGPVLFTQHTLSKGTLKMTAQMPPIGLRDRQDVQLERQINGTWETIATAPIDAMARTATFRVDQWDASQDWSYRVRYELFDGREGRIVHFFEGTIRKDPVDKDQLVVAGFTGNNDLGFPNQDLVGNVEKQNPDVMFFSGDQIYEGVAGYGPQRSPVDKAALDYLRKWYLYGWTYGHLMKDRPTIAIPDDHDVYHGNIWGEAGKAVDHRVKGESPKQDTGGYKMPPDWVNMVQRTQTAHLPDPYDATPVKQGITVYYTDMIYGGVSFAIIEDRKFKSAPKALLPEGQVENGWYQNRDFDPKTQADHPEAILLGQRQLTFLDDWASDWSHGTWMKVLLSQTIFANVATLPENEFHDRVVPQLRILNPDEYAQGDRPVADMDSNGWPQSGRNRALKTIRKAFAFHLAGDQHLGSTIRYGVDEWGDAGHALCVPSVSNVWPRRWYPPEPGKNQKAGAPKYSGDFEDGFGNKMTVLAVSNPYFTGREPSRLYDRATGYGIVKFDRESRDIEMANWPRDTDPTTPDAQPYPDWPIRVNQMDQYARSAVAYLPEIEVSGMQDPVVQIVDESNDEVVYTLRIKGQRYVPGVFKMGSYTVHIGEPGTDRMKTFTGVDAGSIGRFEVAF